MDIWIKMFSSTHPLSNTWITKYFNYERRFNSDFSRNQLSIIKDRAYVINLIDKKGKGIYWVSLLFERDTAAYLDSFGIEYIHQEALSKIKD